MNSRDKILRIIMQATYTCPPKGKSKKSMKLVDCLIESFYVKRELSPKTVKALKQLMLEIYGSADKLENKNYHNLSYELDFRYDTALRLMAVGEVAGLWKMKSPNQNENHHFRITRARMGFIHMVNVNL